VAKRYLMPENRTVGFLIPLPPEGGKPVPPGSSIKDQIIR